VELAELARAGIHPPAEMPFAVAWTDHAGEPEFVDMFLEHHRGARAAWDPDEWVLQLGTWAEGALGGSQALRGQREDGELIVDSGSWLGQAFQRRGYGTEMRAAVLELAFRGLGAVAATSGSLEGNVASARVSAKLGYEPDGEATLAPRGVPVRERRYRLPYERWRSPVPVEIENLEPCLQLFGVT